MANPSADLYDELYYRHYCGDLPYERTEAWLRFFGGVADRIVAEIAPKTVLDAGCALGLLVESLRDRQVEAYGVDISEYAIRSVRPDIAPYCWNGSITDPLPRRYDLVVSIEVLEHLPREEAEKAVANLCQFTDDVLFSSSPIDYREATHFNVKPPEYWAELFLRQGFVRDVDCDASFITSWAVRFRRQSVTMQRLVHDYERRFWPVWKENAELRSLVNELRGRVDAFERDNDGLKRHRAAADELLQLATQRLAEIENSLSWRMVKKVVPPLQRALPKASVGGRLIASTLERGMALSRGRIRPRTNDAPVATAAARSGGAAPVLDRRAKALHAVNRAGRGLEVGPSFNAMARKSDGFDVEIVDHATADELREKYRGSGVDLASIEEVDYIWRGEPLDELLAGKRYDWIIASHVIEHIVNPIGFLQQCARLLAPGGVISLVVPDKRYCFDYFRSPSMTGDFLQAFVDERRCHAPGVVFDQFAQSAKRVAGANGASAAPGEISLVHGLDEAKSMFERSRASKDYIDVHAWRFTPASFRVIMTELRLLGLLPLEEACSFPTEGIEFFVTLRAASSATAAVDRDALYEEVAREIVQGFTERKLLG